MRKHIYTGAMGSIWASLISGILFIYFGNAIGLSVFQWGLLGGISSWVIATQLLSARLTERTGRRKVIWFIFALVDRGLRFIGILASFILWKIGYPYAGIVLITAIALSNLFGTMSSAPWMSWLADIVPKEEHGSFWGRRTAWIALSTITVTLAAGWYADWIPEQYKVHAILVIFSIATLFGIIDILIHGTIPEPRMVMPVKNHFLSHVLEPIRDNRFRPWLVFNFWWTLAMSLGGALAGIYWVVELELKRNFLGGIMVTIGLTLLGNMMTSTWSGKLVDRAGAKKVLFWGHLFWTTLPIYWFLATPDTALFWIGVSSVVGGISTTAAINAANKIITRLPPQGNRAMYIAVSASLGSIAAGFGVMGAGLILRLLENWSLTIMNRSFGAFHLLFIISTCTRLLCTLLFIRRIGELDNNLP